MNPPAAASNRGRTRIWIAATLALVVAGALAAAAAASWLKRGDKDKKPPPVALEFVTSEVTRPQLARLPIVVDFSGHLVAPRMAIVRAKAAGSLLALKVAEGHRVRAGQVIGQIDLAELQSRASDRAATSNRRKQPFRKRNGSTRQTSDSRTKASSRRRPCSHRRRGSTRRGRSSSRRRRSLATSQVGIRQAALTVPISGIVGKRHVVAGEKVSAEQPVVTVVDLSTLELAGSVGTHQVTLLAAGQPVAVAVEGQPQQVQGRIDRIAPTAETGTRAIGVVVTLDNPDERFRAGQYAQARVELADAEPRLTVPITAVCQGSGQDFVWTIGSRAAPA